MFLSELVEQGYYVCWIFIHRSSIDMGLIVCVVAACFKFVQPTTIIFSFFGTKTRVEVKSLVLQN